MPLLRGWIQYSSRQRMLGLLVRGVGLRQRGVRHVQAGRSSIVRAPASPATPSVASPASVAPRAAATCATSSATLPSIPVMRLAARLPLACVPRTIVRVRGLGVRRNVMRPPSASSVLTLASPAASPTTLLHGAGRVSPAPTPSAASSSATTMATAATTASFPVVAPAPAVLLHTHPVVAVPHRLRHRVPAGAGVLLHHQVHFQRLGPVALRRLRAVALPVLVAVVELLLERAPASTAWGVGDFRNLLGGHAYQRRRGGGLGSRFLWFLRNQRVLLG
mmetsp:Transcript_1099/g.2272  ORF Transcript_1099/g.2272 Transcript_1099/m.2272 type:complete len:277 (-) Transcript_1099:1852-2682(-)